jgi:cardiolipin synthase
MAVRQAGPVERRAGGNPGRTLRRLARRAWWWSWRLLVTLLFLGWFFVLRIEERDSWPPPPDAVTAADAEEATAAFLASEDVAIPDLAIPLAPSTLATVEFHSGGRQFFPPMIDDMAAAESSIHILIFTMTPGDVTDRIVPVLEERARAGVEVRLSVDRYGAKVTGKSETMFERLRAAGVEIVVNDIFPLDRDGPFPGGSVDWWQDEVGNADHRKMLVVDGQVGWIGGAGFEDQFEDGRYHDAYARVTGDVVRQMQLVFLTSFHALGGPLPDGGLSRFFPRAIDPGAIPATLLHNVPGGFVPGTGAIAEVIDGAQGRLDILNPYLTDPDSVDRVVAAGQRGVDVTVVIPGRSNVPPAADAAEHEYGRLARAGVEVHEYETIIHAKVIVADDTVVIGTINLDAWALYRNNEIALLIEDPAAAGAARSVLVEDALSRSAPAERPDGRWDRIQDWFWARMVYVL